MASMAIACPAAAADLPSRKPAVAMMQIPAATWTGFYLGLNFGYGQNSNSIATSAPPIWTDPAFPVPAPSYAAHVAIGSTTSAPGGRGAFLLGGQLGYNYQTSLLLAGVEADIQGLFGGRASRSNGIAMPLPPPALPFSNLVTFNNLGSRLDWLATLRGRLGFVAAPSLLLYGTGGLALGGATLTANTLVRRDNNFQTPGFAAVNVSGAHAGWTLGVGSEWKFVSNWSAKLEYLYYDLGRLSGTSALTSSLIFTGGLYTVNAYRATAPINGHIVRAGLNYHFGGAAPARGKY